MLCPKEMVPCLNSYYGCPLSMPRHQLARHLGVCPASVVCCSLEWNRWPIPETDTTFYKNVVLEPNYKDQLDLTMALRDQKLLFSSIKMSTLFPELTEGLNEPTMQEPLGAVGGIGSDVCEAGFLGLESLDVLQGPEVKELTQEERLALAKSKDVACLENYTMWEEIFKKEMQGCKEAVKNLEDKSDQNKKKVAQSPSGNQGAMQCRQDVQESNNVSPVDLTKTGFAPWQDGVLERLRKEVNVAEYNMYLVHNGCMLINFGQLAACTPKEKDFVYGNLEPIEVQTIHAFNVPKSFTAKRGHLKDPSHGAKKTHQNVDTSDLGVTIEELPKSDEVQMTLQCCLEKELRGHQICEAVGTDGLYVDLGTQTYDFPSAPFKPDTTLADITEHKPLNLHLQIQTECVTRRHNKASSAFTYLCCHTFRRDEFPWHFRNVHSDIQSCLTDWFIQRCPLAYLGCTYSQSHFRPSMFKATVSYDQDIGTFALQPQVAASLYKGVKMEISERKRPRNLDSLSRLPFEILQHIAGFLDCMSLRQLSQVSRLMREVCGTLLHQRGMVSLKWEKKIYSHGGSCWKAKKKVSSQSVNLVCSNCDRLIDRFTFTRTLV